MCKKCKGKLKYLINGGYLIISLVLMQLICENTPLKYAFSLDSKSILDVTINWISAIFAIAIAIIIATKLFLNAKEYNTAIKARKEPRCSIFNPLC